jgi:hypothetical protein
MLGGGVKFKTKSPEKLLEERGLGSKGKVQTYIDHEVMRHMEMYMPKLTGTMINSMIISTQAGSGEVVVNTPYAHKRSEKARKNGLRGPHFFERMKADHKDTILAGAAKISGGKTEK